MNRQRSLLALVASAGIAACSTPVQPTDSGTGRDAVADTGIRPDVTGMDTMSLPDAEAPDTGVPVDSGPMCAVGENFCGGACTDTQTNPAHCGACDRACSASEVCRAGVCAPAVMCMAGETACGGGCVNTQTDINNCGACNNACMANQRCSAGACVAARVCPAGEIDCTPSGASMTCVNTTTSTMHCGACGNACAAGDSCVASTCQPPMCPAGQTRCTVMGAQSCIDTQTDNSNCGMCGNACPAGQACMAGACRSTCVAPRLECDVGGTPTCLEVQTDNSNCGMCGNACTGGRTCQAGTCSCPAGRMLCGGVCVDLQSDEANCGMCARTCGAAQTCTAGACACPRGQTACGAACVNTQTDLANCGMCGNRCTAPSTCSAGVCNSLCGPGTTQCGGVCVALTTFQTDNNNCGSCGVRCTGADSCQAGVCRPRNDLRANATIVTLNAAREVTVTGTNVGALRDGPTVMCGCTSTSNVWYRFTVPVSGVVYLDTAGSTFDTSLFITDAAGVAVPAQPQNGFAQPGLCNDDTGCGVGGGFTSGLQSRSAGYLAAGTYYASVQGCGTGTFTLHFQYAPSSSARVFAPTRITGTGNSGNATMGASTSATAGTCSSGNGVEHARWFLTCGATATRQLFSTCRSDPGALFTRRLTTTSTTIFDPVMYVRSAQTGAQVSCNDDGAGVGVDCRGINPIAAGSTVGGLDSLARGSRLSGLATPRGLGVVYVDSLSLATGMIYNMRFEAP
jgi:hypothetical protein